MNVCKECGVRVDDGIEACPLCGSSLREPSGGNTDEEMLRQSLFGGEPPSDPQVRRVVRDARIWLLETASLIAFTAGIIVFAADFAFGFSLSWSQYPLLAIGFVYLLTVAILGLGRRWPWLLAVQVVIIALFMTVLSLLLGSAALLAIAVPITICLGVLIGATAAAIAHLRLNIVQATAAVFLSSGFGVVAIELIITRAKGQLLASWSLIAFACTLSLFVLMLFIDRRVRERHAEFRKIFHL